MEEFFRIQGAGGKKTLKGDFVVSGAKNAALKMFGAAFLFADGFEMRNVPEIEDIRSVAALAEKSGLTAKRVGEGKWQVGPAKGEIWKMDEELSRKIRASIVLTGPILSRFGKVEFSFPGGCNIGKRPIDQFLDGYRAMGAKVSEVEQEKVLNVTITAPKGGLRGAEIFMRNPSHTATETLMMAGVLARGKTVLKNAAMEPEIVALAEYLVACGAAISGAGTPTIEIVGGKLLKASGRPYVTIPDRIEAGSIIVLASLLGKKVTIRNCEPCHLDALIAALKLCGVRITTGPDFVEIFDSGKNYRLPDKSLTIKTQGYPGFPTDLQAPMISFFTQVDGDSVVFETIFESRLEYIQDLVKMGASIVTVSNNQAFIHGSTPLVGKEMKSLDLRSGMAFVIAGLLAKGESLVHNAYNIDRGYANIEGRLKNIGAKIERVRVEP